MLQEAADLVRPLASARAIDFTVRLGDQAGRFVSADRQRLKQVLLNLAANGIKYNRDGGSVVLAAPGDGAGGIRLAVSDTGPGIPEEKMSRLFSPFDRLDAEQTNVEGTGLGLALSKRLVEAMGGTIGAESSEGRGSTFWVELPPATPEGMEVNPEGNDHPRDDAAMTPARSASVLYVEDNVSNFRLIERVLEKWGDVNLLSAMQGGLGLELARQHLPDMILLDLNLPDMHGERVLMALMEDQSTRDIPVVVVSADATPGQIQRLLDAGARAYLTKPIDVKELFGVLDEFLAA